LTHGPGLVYDSGMDGYKYGAPGLAAPIYRVTEDNPIVDTVKGVTLIEVTDRLDQLRTTLEAVSVGYEQEVVQGEIQRLEGLLAQHKGQP